MGYRGSKSDLHTSNKNKSVKEQRVDGSCLGFSPKLRCTLVGGESRYRIRIPSKQLNVKKLSTFNYPSNVNPWFWSGLIDAEASFSIIVDKNQKRTLGWRVESKFQFGVHIRDLTLLVQLQQFLSGIGSIYLIPTRNKVNYSINSKKDLTILINHLENILY
jgi:hypothetical protein